MEYNFNFGNPIFRGDIFPLHMIPDDLNLQAQHFVYRNHRIAGFELNGEKYICIPQAFDIFLKNLVGGLHTVYTKLKRLNIQPIICNVEQVRELRNMGAIQPGVNRYCTCLEARPGRPPKRLLSMDQWASKRDKFEEKESCSKTSINSSECQNSNTPNVNNQNIMNAIFHQQLLFQQMLVASNVGRIQNKDIRDRNENTMQNERTQTWNEKYMNVECKDNEDNNESQSVSCQNQNKDSNDDTKTFSSFFSEKSDSKKGQENNSSTSSSSTKNILINSEPNSHSSIETCDSIKSTFTDRGSSGSSDEYTNGNNSMHNKNSNGASIEFLMGKLSSIIEQADNTFKQHYEKMDLIIEGISKISEVMSNQSYLMNKLEEERKRCNTYMKKYLNVCRRKKQITEEKKEN
ncbi:Dachshund [Strongyloides ratti]|uniref:Dachshund n=1 Tax=Strongyloides ratti TaxID=34506 RepID=A0A090LIV3_STRRB|nr:Dachshund [Strongyloides ratti]CEF67440.1 Dachshund [Strongyloides ratti]